MKVSNKDTILLLSTQDGKAPIRRDGRCVREKCKIVATSLVISLLAISLFLSIVLWPSSPELVLKGKRVNNSTWDWTCVYEMGRHQIPLPCAQLCPFNVTVEYPVGVSVVQVTAALENGLEPQFYLLDELERNCTHAVVEVVWWTDSKLTLYVGYERSKDSRIISECKKTPDPFQCFCT